MSVSSGGVEPALSIVLVMTMTMGVIHFPVVILGSVLPVAAVLQFFSMFALTVLAGDVIRPARGCRKLI